MTTYISLIIAILAFSVIVLVHEFGHLIAAKKNGIFVIEFALGMGPKLVGKQIGETLYTLRLLPIGGYCKMLGEDEDSDDPRSFGKQSVGARIVVIVAGAIMNFVLGIVLLFVLMLMQGYATSTVKEVPVDMPAYEAGIREGDVITSINGRKVHIFDDIYFSMNFVDGSPMKVGVRSNGEEKILEITPQKTETVINGETHSSYKIGIAPLQYTGILGSSIEGIEKASIMGSIANSFEMFRFYVRVTYESLGMLITGAVSPKELSGVVGIGDAFVESVKQPIETEQINGQSIPLSDRIVGALVNVLNITVLITINLGIMNLLPLPALDGGRAIFLIVEGIRKKPIDPNKEGAIHFAGFVLLMLLMVFVTYNDILRVFIKG